MGASADAEPDAEPDAGDGTAEPDAEQKNPENVSPDPYLVNVPPWKIFNRAVALSYMRAPTPAGIADLPVSEGPALPTFHRGPDLCATAGPPNTDVYVLIDGTHVRTDAYGDRALNRLVFSGKVRQVSLDVNLCSDPGGLVIGKSPAVPGSVHDFKLLKDHLPDFGYLTEIMLRNDLPEWARPAVVVDKGYIGIRILLPGARIMIPIRRGSGSDEGGEFSQKDRDHNRERWPR